MEKYWDFNNNNGVLTIYGGRGTTVLPESYSFGNKSSLPWHKYRLDIKKIVFDVPQGETLAFGVSASDFFRDYSNVTTIEGLENVSTANVTNMASMFQGMNSLTSLDVSSFDTSNVTNMSYMFNRNIAYQTNKVKFRNNIDFTKKLKKK